MKSVSRNSREYREATRWFNSTDLGIKLRLQINAGIINGDQFREAFGREFNCTVIVGDRGDDRLEFDSEEYCTWFLLKWS